MKLSPRADPPGSGDAESHVNISLTLETMIRRGSSAAQGAPAAFTLSYFLRLLIELSKNCHGDGQF
jgi:hypothetical protein